MVDGSHGVVVDVVGAGVVVKEGSALAGWMSQTYVVVEYESSFILIAFSDIVDPSPVVPISVRKYWVSSETIGNFPSAQ